jgi:hypothetical protein
LKDPILSDLLADEEPFVISSLPLARQNGRLGQNGRPYAFGQLHEKYEFMLNGIGLLDHELGLTYLANRGERIFQIECESVCLPWHIDKFDIYANRYGTGLSCSELKSEFKRLGYSFAEKPVKS